MLKVDKNGGIISYQSLAMQHYYDQFITKSFIGFIVLFSSKGFGHYHIFIYFFLQSDTWSNA